jgi:hypothetical protein
LDILRHLRRLFATNSSSSCIRSRFTCEHTTQIANQVKKDRRIFLSVPPNRLLMRPSTFKRPIEMQFGTFHWTWNHMARDARNLLNLATYFRLIYHFSLFFLVNLKSVSRLAMLTQRLVNIDKIKHW